MGEGDSGVIETSRPSSTLFSASLMALAWPLTVHLRPQYIHCHISDLIRVFRIPFSTVTGCIEFIPNVL